tara:strand:+ start:66 stop:401 length:336 start_codon:yes stop_codon:yes gene_type:complete
MTDKLTPRLFTPQEDYDNLDPMGDLAKAFNGIDVFPSLEQENRKLKEINKNIQTKLNQTERELAKLKENVNLSCKEMMRILGDGQEYGHTEDYTEAKRLELKKHYNWKDSL